ncbi:hypothetical protein ACFMBG_19550 [Leisingera sp. D0M16]|uniref:hypothetical protein n=1 Tax=Leisingera coralii TaxID=3351347 RepID=UPI003B7CAC2B
MSHPPFKAGIPAMDRIMMLDAEPFHEVIATYKSLIRHLFFDHVHHAISGNWRRISFSCRRGLSHQAGLELSGDGSFIGGGLVCPAYGVALLDAGCVTVHMHDFACRAPKFPQHSLDGTDPETWQLEMGHEGFLDP